MKKLYIIMAAVLLTGCASSRWGDQASGGGATYRYTKSAAGDITVEITTSRDVSGGNISVGANGELQATAETAGGTQESISIIRDLVGKLPEIK